MPTDQAAVDTHGAMSPTEQAVGALIHEVLRRPPTDAARTHLASLIDGGALDWAGLARSLRSSPAYRERYQDPENRDAVTNRVKAASRSRVLVGPFAGMRIADRSNRGDGDLAPKLLGTYEQELHAAIRDCAGNRYDAIIDIGAAEGYYAIGLALLLPVTPVFAFDTDPLSHAALAANAALNGCADRISIGGRCDTAALHALYDRYPRTLVVSDCEGCEAILFTDSATNAAGRSADLLIECHDHWDATITPALIAALSPTHAITRIDQGGRDPNAFACLADLDEWDRWRAIWERRGPAEHWLLCRSQQAAS